MRKEGNQETAESLLFPSAEMSVGVGIITGPQIWVRKDAGEHHSQFKEGKRRHSAGIYHHFTAPVHYLSQQHLSQEPSEKAENMVQSL